MNGNGTGTELVPVLDMGNGNGTSSTFEKENGTERSSKNFGTGPITGQLYYKFYSFGFKRPDLVCRVCRVKKSGFFYFSDECHNDR